MDRNVVIGLGASCCGYVHGKCYIEDMNHFASADRQQLREGVVEGQ